MIDLTIKSLADKCVHPLGHDFSNAHAHYHQFSYQTFRRTGKRCVLIQHCSREGCEEKRRLVSVERRNLTIT